MIVIGFSGGPDWLGHGRVAPGLSPLFFHDAAAALAIDGRLTFAIEEERLTRQKHTNSFPASGIRACLEHGNVCADQVDRFAFFFEEDFYTRSLAADCLKLGVSPPPAVRSLLVDRLSEALDFACPAERLCFINHHRAHARSVFSASGFDECLVAVVDGNGETDSFTLFSGIENRLTWLTSVPASQSLGRFYRHATRLAGFQFFDEYKFMGLAPYGRAGPIDAEIQRLIEQGKDGRFTIDFDGLAKVAYTVGVGPSVGGMPDQPAADFAQAVQRVLERTIIGFLRPWIRESGLRRLCLAGGVAQNCVMNSRLAEVEELERVFVYPAAHDGGAPAGAALEASIGIGGDRYTSCTSAGSRFNARLGLAVADDAGIERVLRAWSPALDFRKIADPPATAGELIANGKIIGHVSGRSEFGPRALGARSILADPRPVSNWSRINLAIKDRESFRPFAPACLEECVSDYFECPPAAENLRHMTFVSRVREDKRAYLAAVTHVDGTARLQTVSREYDPEFHALVSAFQRASGCPVVLNTSFNTSAEPIVQSADDAVQTFLKTALDALVMGNWLITKRGKLPETIGRMEVRLSAYAEAHGLDGGGDASVTLSRPPFYEMRAPDEIRLIFDEGASDRWVALEPILDQILRRADLEKSVLSLWRLGLLDLRYVLEE